MPPVALLAIAFAVGIALREAGGLPRLACVVGVVAASVALGVAFRARRGFGMAALVSALAIGSLAASLAWPAPADGLLDGEPWEVTARVLEAPERAFGRVHVTVELERVARDRRVRAASGRVRLALDGDPVEPLLPGDLVRFRARLAPPRGFVEPDAPDPGRRAAERGLVAVAGLERTAIARVIPDAASDEHVAASRTHDAARWITAIRARLLARLAAHLDGERRALVESLILGERGGVPRDLDDAFRAAGVNHVLSVSGLHLAMAAFLLLVGLRRLLLRVTPLARRVAVHRIAAACALPATLAYALVTGGAIATLRALVVAWVFLGGMVVGRPPLALAALGTAALVLLGASPLALYDPSLQLSFAAALGASQIVPPAMQALRRRFPRALDGGELRARAVRLALGLLLTSAAAIAASAPLTAWHFAQVAPAGLVANLAVVPLAEWWVMPAGLAGCALAPLDGHLAAPLLHLAGIGAAAMAALARFFAAFPAGRVRAPTVVEAMLFYGMLLAGLLWLRGHGRGARRAAFAFALALGAVVGIRAAAARALPSLVVTFLDIGQGDSAFVELPDGRTMLVDGGGALSMEDEDRFDPGAQVIVPWLQRRGVRRIDYVVLTHPHPDHAGGLPSVVEKFEVGEIWTNGVEAPLPALARLRSIAAARGVPVVRPHGLDGAARVEVLAPLVGGEVRAPVWFGENDGSIVLRLVYRGRAVLLTGDIEKRGESRLVGGLEHPGPIERLAADVVKAPHHGSRTSSTIGFVEATHPRAVVFSDGAMNRWGFPAPEVVARWRDIGARTFRTDEDGGVTVRVSAFGGLSVETARGRRESP